MSRWQKQSACRGDLLYCVEEGQVSCFREKPLQLWTRKLRPSNEDASEFTPTGSARQVLNRLFLGIVDSEIERRNGIAICGTTENFDRLKHSSS
jgi:hypothetical protein